MFERSEVAFKILCAGLAALVLWQVVRALERSDPLAGASIPALPSLPGSTNAPAGGMGGKEGMLLPGARNIPAPAKGTNTLAPGSDRGTNAAPKTVSARGTNVVGQGTNVVAQGTNVSMPPSGPLDTRPSTRSARGPAMMNAGPFPGMPGMPGQGPPLPPAVQARLDRIIESEILAPVMRPQPVALLGIVGRDAFLQAPNGQSGLLKEGEEMGGIKLLSLGINRALIEEAGEKKELTLFSGLGSESLLSKQTNSP